jgi:hypothetical protein
VLKKLVLILAATLLLPLCSRADSCAAGTVLTILNTTCTIGDKTFQFGNYSFTLLSGISENPALVFYFTPDVNPNDPGFTLSATSGKPFTPPPAGATPTGFTFALSYVVSITNPLSGATILGTTVSQKGATVASSGSGSVDSAIASNTLTPGFFLCTDEAQAGAAIPGPLPYPSTNDSLILGCSGVTSTPGTAEVSLSALNGSAALTSGTFLIDETGGSIIGAAPEPSTLLLFGAGLLPIFTYRTRRTFAAFHKAPRLRKQSEAA